MSTHQPEDLPEDQEHHDPDGNLAHHGDGQVQPDRLSSLPLLTGVPAAGRVPQAPLPRAITRRGRRPVLGLAGPTPPATTTPAADAPPPPALPPDSDIDVRWATGTTVRPASLVETGTDAPSPAHPQSVAADPAVVRQMRELASSRLTERFVGDEDEDDRKQAARAIIADLLNERDRSDTFDGRTLTPPALRKALSKAVFDALFGLGRLQTLMEDDQVEDIEVNGTEPVQVQYADGTWRSYPSPFDSNADLVEYIQFLGTHHQADRPFSPAQPHLHLPLKLGDIRARLYATGWLTDVPAIRIRLHRHVHVTLDDLVELGTVGPELAGFLAAAVRARRSIVISGSMGGGKTTLLRALTRCLPFTEGIVTLETERELWLNEIPGYTRVLSYESRPGSGEIDAHGRPAGMVTIADIFPHVLRANVTRIIVGEVRGREAAAMFEAMQSGAGSLSTIHAKSAADTIERLTLAVHSAGGSETYADRLVAHQIDLIVHLKVHRDRVTGIRRRIVDEVLEVAPGEQGRPAITTLFAQHPGAGGTAATPRLSPSFMDDLVDEGLDPACFSTGLQQGWADA